MRKTSSTEILSAAFFAASVLRCSGSPEANAASSGAGDSGCDRFDPKCPRFATGVRDHRFGSGPTYGQGSGEFPKRVLGPPRGGGLVAGSLDVTTLGQGGSIVVEFGGSAIVDGPGADFIVFENPFSPSGKPNDVFAEPAAVAVSDDGAAWKELPCTAKAPPYDGCAGTHPVYANFDTNDIDPFDPAVAGGDPFDLADFGVPSARFVRITDRADLGGSLDCCFDLDAVSIVNVRCP